MLSDFLNSLVAWFDFINITYDNICVLQAMMRCNNRLVASLWLVIAVILLASRYYDRDEILQQSLKTARQSYTKSLSEWTNEQGASGHVLTLEFTGQLMAGLRGIMSMQCWLASFGLHMSIVEPYVINSKLVNGIKVWSQFAKEPAQDQESIKPLMLTDYFNMSMFNHASERNGRPLLTSWESAPRKLIVATVSNPFMIKDCMSYTKAGMCNKEEDLEEITFLREQFLSGCQPSGGLANSIGYLKERGFNVVRSVCLNCDSRTSNYFTPTEITRHIFGEYNPSEVTLLISHWKFSFEMTPTCIRCKQQAVIEGNPLALFAPSPQLLEHADTYIKSLRTNPHTKLVAIMIRIEWFLIMYRRSSLETVRECLSKVLKEYNKYLSAHPITRTVLALDIGKYGSGTFNWTFSRNNITQDYFTKVVEEIHRFVKEVDLEYGKWEESFESVTGRGYDRGYIALLQSVIVSRADYVIRMGGGHYQQLAIQLFLKNQHHTQHSSPDQNQVTDVCIRHRMQ